MKVAIVPARGGSQRIPRKNVRPFGGRPMIAWSIDAALACGCFDRVVVSTEDAEIAAVARACGAEVPFTRPAALADHHAGTLAVMHHAVDALGLADADLACCIYATAPFIEPQDLRRGLALLQGADADYAFSVTRYAFPIQRAIRLTPDGRVAMFDPAQFATRSQDLEDAFHDAAQFYWGRVAAWRAERALFAQGSLPVTLPRHRVQDIDTPEDWERAEWLWRAMQAARAADDRPGQ